MSHIAQGLFQPSQLLCERYRVVELLGGGEKTEVYKVHDTLRNKLLALKVLREVKGKNDELTLRREFYYLSKLYHPRVVTVYDFGITPERKPYFTMEYVPGMPITRYFSGKFNPDLIEVITQLLRALDYIHSQGLLHCDLKPQHILVFEDNGKPQTKLLDFGFAERREFSKNVSARGTLGYIAPEVFKGVDTDVRADLYSLGVVLYETLTGITPGEGKDIYDWLRRQYTSGFLPPRKFNPEIPEELESLIMQLLSIEPERRPASARAAFQLLTKSLPEEITPVDLRGDLMSAGFVGRQECLNRLKEWLRHSKEGRPGVVCISGERGAGKSRLLTEFKFFAQLEGATVLAFEPVSLGARSQSLIEAMLNLLRLYGVSIELNLDTAVETKFRLFETVTQRLKSLADSHRIPHSLVIIVDDFEMFDPTSLEFLRYLAFGLDKERLLLVVTGLNEKRFLDLIDALVEKRYCEHIPIPPLEQEEVKNLLSSLLGEVIEIDTLTSWLFHLTGGNPLWTIETVYALIENKILVRDGLRWRLVSEKLQKFQAPQAVTEVVRRRIERLTPDEMEVLNIGAVASGPFTVEFLRAVGNFDEQALFTIISRLKGLGFLRTFRSLVDEKDVSLDTYILSSKILETAITERLSIPQRRELHRRVALTLELLYPEKIPEMIFDLAHHWAQTEIKDRAYRYSLQAGAKAQEWLLFEQALSFYEQGLALSNELISPQEKLQLMETVGKLREATGRFAEAIDLYRQGMGILVAHPELSFNKKILARFLQLIGLVHQKQGQTTEALNFLKQALLLEPDRTGLDYARLLADLGWSYCAIGNFNQAEEVLSQALNLAENLKSIKPLEANRLIAQTLYSFSVLAYSRSDLISARRLAERSLEVYELAQDEIMSARVRQFTATLYLRISEPQKAKECYLQALTIQQRSGDVYSQLRSLHGLGLINLEEGNWDDAYERFSEALRLAEKINDVASEVNLCGMLGTVCTEKGEWSLAQDYFQRALETASRAGERVDPSALVRSLINFAQLKARKGDLQEAEENIKSAVDLADETPDPNLRYYLLLLQAEVALRRERFEQTRAFLVQAFNLVHSQIGFGKEKDWRLLTTLYLLASQFRLTTKDFYRAEFAANYALRFLNKYPTYRDYPVALRLTGLAKCYLGRAKEGKEAINRSIQILRHLGAKYELGLSLLASAEAVLRVIPKEQEKGNGEINPEALQEIEENLKEALSIFQTLGAKFEIARTEELLNDLKRTYGVAQLKARERTKYLKVFYQLSELIHLGIEKEDFLDQVLDLLISVTKAERGLLFLLHNNRLHPVAIRSIERATLMDAEMISHSVLEKVKQRGEPAISVDAITDGRFNIFNSVLLNKIRSLLCVPLVVEERVLGTIYLDSRLTSHLWTEDDRNLLTAVANLLAATIERSPAFQMLQEETGLSEEVLIDVEDEEIFLSRSKAMRAVHQVIDRIAPTDCTVLLTGETGTGKGVLARLIHQRSSRKEKKFVPVNCGTLPETLFESELFGHIRGSFTGAIKDKMGIFESANGGTVFLDEITNTTPAIQAKLLQVLEEKTIRRLGETETRRVDVRLLCATNKNLIEEVKAGRFREDLFYRINVVNIYVPPLRERADDIPALANYFLRRHANRFQKPLLGFDEGVIAAFTQYHWPGNVRELQNAIERAVIITDKKKLSLEDFGAPFVELSPNNGFEPVEKKKRRHLDREKVVQALKETKGNITRAAELLSIHRRHLQRLIKRYQIDRDVFGQD